MQQISDIQHLEAHRSAITGHCYRMLGSFYDAEDATQEAMLRAWKGLDRFDGRSSLKNWLYRIATNVCLDEIHNQSRRARPMEEGPAFSGIPSIEDLAQRPPSAWIEPISDARALPSDSDPSERAMLKQSIRLAFIAALQKLAPKQRAALSDRNVTSSRDLNPDLTEPQKKLLNSYVSAFERYDLETLTTLLQRDATLSMRPMRFSSRVRRRSETGCWAQAAAAAARGCCRRRRAARPHSLNTAQIRRADIKPGHSSSSSCRMSGSPALTHFST